MTINNICILVSMASLIIAVVAMLVAVGRSRR